MRRMLAPYVVCLLSVIPPIASADLLLSSPPRGKEAEEKALHEPIAKAMTEWLGTRVTYEYAQDFTTFSSRMREGRYDILFDGAHFAAWRKEHLHYHILANLPGDLVFLTITGAENASIVNTESLVGKRVCAQAPPQLGTLMLISQYSSPAQEPFLHATRTEPGVYDAFKQGKCEAAVLRDKAYFKLSDEERRKYRVIFSSRPVPNVTLSVSPRLTTDQRELLARNLTRTETAEPAKALLDKYSKDATKLNLADPEQFRDLHTLLENHSFGWE